jgi:hypothetical protein
VRKTVEQHDDHASLLDASVPEPASERGAWATAILLGLLGAAVLVLALSGLLGGVASRTSIPTPPRVIAVTPTPPPAPVAVPVSEVTSAHTRAIVGRPSSKQVHADLALYETPTSTHIAARWMQGFYGIYATAQRTFGVNWLLIASIHKQESAFSTAPSTYHGLNFAACCGGPMQFNVTNGPVTTWALVNDSYRYGARPSAYNHITASHPSIYDDFDAIMAGAHLLSADGAGYALDGSAWNAAYDYYGHDATGVTYADQVLARAIGWSQHGFCINCGLEAALVAAVHSAYGAPVAATFETASTASVKRPGRTRRR